jgi:hypothetical protein
MGEAKLGGASRTGYRPPLRSPPHFVQKKERSKKKSFFFSEATPERECSEAEGRTKWGAIAGAARAAQLRLPHSPAHFFYFVGGGYGGTVGGGYRPPTLLKKKYLFFTLFVPHFVRPPQGYTPYREWLCSSTSFASPNEVTPERECNEVGDESKARCLAASSAAKHRQPCGGRTKWGTNKVKKRFFFNNKVGGR